MNPLNLLLIPLIVSGLIIVTLGIAYLMGRIKNPLRDILIRACLNLLAIICTIKRRIIQWNGK